MSSDPTDLIRAVDKHQACCRNASGYCACLECGEHWPCDVRRLRDALEASEAELAENEAFINVWRNRTYRAEAALAEANATIEKVRDLHVPVRMYTANHSTEWHWECAECEGDTFPCDTTKAIDGEQA